MLQLVAFCTKIGNLKKKDTRKKFQILEPSAKYLRVHIAEFATVKYEKVANELENCLLEKCSAIQDVFSVVVCKREVTVSKV